ncbi:MAG: hypothetical protein H6809_04905 [Phycisphaeraceae bacterium]|nr:hypothetical protein [Phycisphaeraceae bacterium]
MNSDRLFGESVPAPASADQHATNTPDLTRLPLSLPAHHKAPRGTSEVAAKRAARRAPTHRQRLYAAIVDAGEAGATDAELEELTGIRAQTISPRRGELVRMGLVVDSGRRRNTPRNSPAAVWVALPRGGAQ